MFGLAFLVACGLYAWVAFFVAKNVGKGTGSKLAKYLTLAAFALVFTWDVIPGQLYFNHLCETQAGAKVIKTVYVDNSYFTATGKPDQKLLADRYSETSKFDGEFFPLFHIEKIERAIQDKQSGEVLGTGTNFSYRGGWLSRFVFVDGGATLCPDYRYFGESAVMWQGAIKPTPSSIEGGK